MSQTRRRRPEETEPFDEADSLNESPAEQGILNRGNGMDYMELFTQIKRGKLGSLYLFHGPEEFTKEEALSQIIGQIQETIPGL